MFPYQFHLPKALHSPATAPEKSLDEDVDEDSSAPTRGVLVMTMAMIPPLREGSFPGRIVLPVLQIGSAQVPPRGGGETTKKLFLDFFSGRNPSYSRRGGPEGQLGAHKPPRRG